MRFLSLFVSISLLFFTADSQDYAEYARGYGQKKNSKGSLVAGILGGVLGSVVGGWMTSRRMKKRNEKEKKDLLQYMHLQEEIYRQREAQWQAEYSKLYKAYEDLEKDTIDRDYEEFKAPDTNNDDMISRSEFNTYVKKYLSSFPELSERDFPRFEEFDLDGDGIVSFEEWQQYLYLQKQKEAAAAKSGKQQTGQYADLLSAMYEQSAASDSFNSLQKNMGKDARGKRRV